MDQRTYEVAAKIGLRATMRVEHEETMANAWKKGTAPPITVEELADHRLNISLDLLWTCADKKRKLHPTDYEEIYIHARVAVDDDAAFKIGSANLNLRSTTLDSELNVTRDTFDVAYKSRTDVFVQCGQDPGAQQFGDMARAFKTWAVRSSKNSDAKRSGNKLEGHLLPFYVDSKPESPVM